MVALVVYLGVSHAVSRGGRKRRAAKVRGLFGAVSFRAAFTRSGREVLRNEKPFEHSRVSRAECAAPRMHDLCGAYRLAHLQNQAVGKLAR